VSLSEIPTCVENRDGSTVPPTAVVNLTIKFSDDSISASSTIGIEIVFAVSSAAKFTVPDVAV
jgi:hypothetical protein